MAVQITSKENQASGAFAGGAILENKPIGFPQDGGSQKPFSNLFYWANAWSDNGGLIGEHPHKMFEIMSFVIAGEIQHYDSKFDRWLSLNEGGAQIIRSGNGITHAERIMPGGRMFQIWFDPNIQKTIKEEASYNDYQSTEMKYISENGISIKNYIGNGGPIKMESEGIEINEFRISKGHHQLALNNNKIYAYYVLKGAGGVDDKSIKEHDFITVEDQDKLDIVTNAELVLFVVATPQQLSYPTYLELTR